MRIHQLRKLSANRVHSGQALSVELVVGIIVFVGIALALLDFAVLALSWQANLDLAKKTARAAGMQRANPTNPSANTSPGPQAAANYVITQYNSSQKGGYINTANLVNLNYNWGDGMHGNVVAQISMNVHLPVPLFTINQVTIYAQDQEPIMMQP